MTENGKKRYACVGTGGRCVSFINPIAKDRKDVAELVGLCDVNEGRTRYHQQRLIEEYGYHEVPTYHADDFDKMIKEQKPDVVIVTTVDAYHHEYIIRAMELGCDVVTEKPMTIDAEKCQAILDAQKKTGRNIRVTFNYRWTPGRTKVKELLASGAIGEIVNVDLEYLLNTSHGADYYRRWHREKDKSGGLMVHKATHHFDLVNWWLDAIPEEVFGYGKLAFYGKENAAKRGESYDYDRYTGHVTPEQDPFALDLSSNDKLKAIYLDQEQYDGYKRDRNVFGEPITIEDSMSVIVKYRNGVVLNYSLNSYLPREGMHTVFNGTKGRLEWHEIHESHIIAGQDDEELGEEMQWESQIILHPMFGKARKIDPPKATGGHGGGDARIQDRVFGENLEPDAFGRDAGHEQGAASILVGIAANKAFETGNVVKISDLCPQLDGKVKLSELV